MASNPDSLYNITIKNNKNGKKLSLVSGRSALTINHDQVSRTPGKSGDEIAWNFKNTGEFKTYEALDFYRFSTGSGSKAANLDLSNYSIILSPKNNPNQVSNLFIQIGNQSMSPQKSGNQYTFDLSKNPGIKKYLKGQTSNNYSKDNGVRTFTVFEFLTSDDKNNYFGKNNLVISTGPIKYDLPTKNTTTIKASDLEDWRDSSYDIYWNAQRKNVTVYVGGIAEKMLEQKKRKDINFVVDERIDSEKKLASQQVVVLTDPGDKAKDYQSKAFLLDWDKKVNVLGSNNGNALIDGTAQSTHIYNQDAFYQFFNGLLDISSSYKAKKKNDFSTSIQGITFLNPPIRNQGTVQANSNYLGYVPANNWWINNNSSPEERLSKAVNEFLDNKISYMDRGSNNDKVRTQIFDNQIIGGWLGASDGFESGAKHLSNGRNFTHISDDNLKILSSNQNFIENTIHQGAYGAPISFAYGAGNGPKFNTNIDGLYIHRITQPDGIINPTDQYGGLVMDWFAYKDSAKRPDRKEGGFGPATFKNIYIPQVNVNNQCTNALNSMGTIEASESNTRNWPSETNSGNYRAGGYTFKKSSKSYVKIQEPLTTYVQTFNTENRHIVPNKTQKTTIYNAQWSANDGPVNVDVFGSNTDNITDTSAIDCVP